MVQQVPVANEALVNRRVEGSAGHPPRRVQRSAAPESSVQIRRLRAGAWCSLLADRRRRQRNHQLQCSQRNQLSF